MKKVLGVYTSARPHWVGDGFPVRTLFSHQSLGQHVSPFLMLDYAGPAQFTPLPASESRGVGQHPHRGFETVTIVYQGEVEHRDSTGSGGIIGPGDVQWMTAGAGILHEEFHSKDFTENGGTLEMIQLWVNLPAKDKMTAPGYQSILNRDIPCLQLPGEAGRVRVIAGEFAGDRGPAHTFTPMDVWDLRLNQGGTSTLGQVEGRNTLLVVMRGSVMVNGQHMAKEGQLVVLGREGAELTLEAQSDATVLLLSGDAIDEPVVAHGPFVMNTKEEIQQAVIDFNSGRFGQMAR
ncbi:pirin family protein [Massilia cavernae]|uniref:Pirin family protein n=1 Tax=Massilia cavernae TaxID=2320864 RepID=A0A418X6Y0_9BURK|nr:pirin family protein [Massilia cavernae]RJG08255.1 pirin family protein [Massilia cavernae]